MCKSKGIILNCVNLMQKVHRRYQITGANHTRKHVSLGFAPVTETKVHPEGRNVLYRNDGSSFHNEIQVRRNECYLFSDP